MRNGQQFVLLVFALLLIGGVVLGTRLAAPPPKTAHASNTRFDETLPPNVTLRLRNVRITGRANGVTAWSLRAGVVDSTRTVSQVAFRDGIEADFLQGGQKRATVLAPQAIYEVNTKQVTASGGVVCKVEGRKSNPATDLRIATPEVAWSIGARTITCPGQVQVSRPGATIRGINLNVDLLSRAYSLHSMEGEFDLGEGSDPEQIFDVLPQAQ